MNKMDRKTEILVIQAEEAMTSIPTVLQNQLLATKFFVPVASGPLICRPRLAGLLNESLKHPLTLVSAPAGFGKTTLAASWAQSLAAKQLQVAWISLDEEDNDPRLFWSYVITALHIHRPERFSSLLAVLQSSQGPPLKYILMALINLLAESTEQFVLILDDYQTIIKQEIHSTIVYLLEHLPPQLRIFMLTRADPSWPLSQLRARQQVLEVRASQLRCTVEETKAFFKEVIGIQLPNQVIQKVTAQTEGWLVGLQLLGLSLPERADPLKLLEEASGNQRYILDYLTEEVLQQQAQEVQMFLLSTCILERLTASLCDAVMQQRGSQQMLERLEQANLFVVSLDSKREWYRYHALFAEALLYRLEQAYGDLVLTLHHRASLWYAEHNQTTRAILHAFRAHQWEWATDLIEMKSIALNAFTWGVSKQNLLLLRDWLHQIPVEMVYARPRFCLACIWMVLTIIPQTILETWLNAAETMLTAQLMTQIHEENAPPMPIPQARQELENMLGEAITYRAFLQCHMRDGEAALALCQRAQGLLSADNFGARTHIAVTQILASYLSSVNNAAAAVQMGLEAGSLNQAAGHMDQAISLMGLTAKLMVGTGQLCKIEQLIQQAIRLGSKPGAFTVGWPMVWQAEVLREWNQLDAALSCIEEAIKLCEQIKWSISLVYLQTSYAILLRICLSRGDYDRACSALQEFEHIGRSMSQFWGAYSFFTTIDQVRLWLACGELERATHWAEKLDEEERQGTPFAREREEVACARVFLAKDQPALALERLKSALQRAATGQRWGHVIEILILQALAQQRHHEEMLALSALSEAVRLAEPEGYIRSFVEEGAPMASLLAMLREEQRKAGPTPYLDTLLAAFPQPSKAHERHSRQLGHTTIPLLPESLSERELEVLRLLAYGASNQEVAQQLVIAVDTVKRHVSHIFAKLGVQNRVQAVRRAQEYGLLDEKST